MIMERLAATAGQSHREDRRPEIRTSAALLSRLGHHCFETCSGGRFLARIFTDEEIGSECFEGFPGRGARMREGEHVGLERAEHRDQ
jgi:hypothetical protein